MQLFTYLVHRILISYVGRKGWYVIEICVEHKLVDIVGGGEKQTLYLFVFWGGGGNWLAVICVEIRIWWSRFRVISMLNHNSIEI